VVSATSALLQKVRFKKALNRVSFVGLWYWRISKGTRNSYHIQLMMDDPIAFAAKTSNPDTLQSDQALWKPD